MRLDGNTSVASRQRLVDRFNSDESYFGMLATTRTGGVGLNLTGANRSRVLALDAVVPVVSPTNPIRGISPQDLAAAFAGKITNWQSLGGPDAPIDLHLPTASSGLSQAIEDQVMVPAKLALAEQVIRHDLPTELVDAVARDTFALGITSYALLNP